MGLDRLISARRPPPDEGDEAEVQKHHAARRNQELAGEEDLKRVHGNEGEGLDRGVQAAAQSAENPTAEQDFHDADHEDRRIRHRISEDFPDDHLMPGDAVEDLAVEAVENPNARDENSGEAVERGGFQVLPHRRWVVNEREGFGWIEQGRDFAAPPGSLHWQGKNANHG